MHSANEVETYKLEKKNLYVKTVLPDGTKPLLLGSGTISGIIGKSGSTVLYEIKNKELGFKRAVKLLRPNHSKDSLERFLKEFKICAQLSHPTIPVVHNVGQWHGLPFIEMEKITGFSLLETIAKFAPLPVGLVTAIGITICKALDYIHHRNYEIDKKKFRGFLHLDLKPSNIILSDTGILKIMDFGMATPLIEAKKDFHPDSSIDTSQYIAPEMLFGKSFPDARSDLFSLGCILFELATGIRVFSGSTFNEIINVRKNHSIPSLKKIDKNIPDKLVNVIEKCLSYDKNNRPDSADSVRSQLEKIHRTQSSTNAEDIIYIYITKSESNEPFNIPASTDHFSMVSLYTSGIISALCIGIIAFLLLTKQNEFLYIKPNFIQKASFLPLKNNPQNLSTTVYNSSKVKPTTSISNTAQMLMPVMDTTGLNKILEINYFYQSSVNPDQAALIDSLRSKLNHRQFDELLLFINTLPEDLASNKEVLLYKLRAMGRNGEELGTALNSNVINDGEYFFHKARYFSGKQNYNDALRYLDKADSIPSEFIDKNILGTEVLLYRARSITALFRQSPTSKNLDQAMNAWQKLLLTVKNQPNNIQIKEALREKNNLASEASWRGIN